MLKKIKEELNKKSLLELETFYCGLYNKCARNCTKQDYIDHIIAYLHMYLKFHKMNEKCTIKAFQILSFVNLEIN